VGLNKIPGLPYVEEQSTAVTRAGARAVDGQDQIRSAAHGVFETDDDQEPMPYRWSLGVILAAFCWCLAYIRMSFWIAVSSSSSTG
jgi:hypothetical protein